MNTKTKTHQKRDNIDPIERRLKKMRVYEARGKVSTSKEGKYKKRPIDYLSQNEDDFL